jgi:endoglucanase
MKHLSIIVSFLSATLAANAQLPIQEIRTASATELVAFFHDQPPTPITDNNVWAGTNYTTNAVNISNPSAWTLNGQAVGAMHEFVTESDGSDYHIYMQVPPLTNGMAYTLSTPYGSTNFVFEDTNFLCESIHVNQNGYSALSQVRYADFGIWLGTGGSQPISGPLPTYTVINQFTGQQVASGTLATVATAQPDSSSGDYVYRLDLSGVPAGGPYQVVVSGYGCSYPFGVGGNFSSRLAYVAFRELYYQQSGCAIVQPYAWANIRPYPDETNIYDNESPDDPSTTSIITNTSGPRLFVHGGYHDAGDAQKNPDALLVPIILMTTYEAFPQDFTSNQFNIPANFDANFNIVPGGNGIPDILNEVNWGLMLYTNLQSTPNEPVGAVAFGTAAQNEPAWGYNFDHDSSVQIYSTETNTTYSSGLAAGAFEHFARLIKPYNPTLSAAYDADAVAAYNAAGGSSAYYQERLYFWIQYYLLHGGATASNQIESLYNNQTYYYTNTFRDEASGFVVNNGQIWLTSYFMSYIIATNQPTDPTIVAYFKSLLQQAANEEVGFVNGDAYPVGWPTNANPYTQNNYTKGPFTSQGEFAYPCLMEWALTGTQKYIDTASQLMDYDQGLNPLGKCYMSGMGFNRIQNPHMIESDYAQRILGVGGPEPGITIYGPGTTQQAAGENTNTAVQIPNANTLPRERVFVDDLGNYQWSEFTDYQSESWPAAIYEVLAQGNTWSPTNGEPFLNPAASIQSGTNGWVLRFGGIPYQTYVLQTATEINGPWSTASGQEAADVTGMVQFTDSSPPSTMEYYRTEYVPPGGAAPGAAPIY